MEIYGSHISYIAITDYMPSLLPDYSGRLSRIEEYIYLFYVYVCAVEHRKYR
jgi:hypothetical protein